MLYVASILDSLMYVQYMLYVRFSDVQYMLYVASILDCQ